MIPLVSVCIPTYNHAHFLPAAIQSALDQTERNLEILIVDNCSTDNTAEVVQQFCSLDGRVRYVRNEVNLGLVGNLNHCLELANGMYIKYLLADDLLVPDCIEQMLKGFAVAPDVVLVASRRTLVNEALQPRRVAGLQTEHGMLDGRSMISHTLFNGNYIGEPTAVMFRTADAVRGFSADFKRLVDVEMWFHLLEKGNLYYLTVPLVYIRQHESQETHGIIRSLDFIDEEAMLYLNYIKQPYIRATLLNRLKWRFKTAWIYPFNQVWQAKFWDVMCRVRKRLGIDVLMPILVARILLSRLQRLVNVASGHAR